MNYDSAQDTKDHIEKVNYFISTVIARLKVRGGLHDLSKLEEPEKSIFDIYTPKLKNSTYGSDEYKQFLEEMKVALDHHYQENRHHPEHFKNWVCIICFYETKEEPTGSCPKCGNGYFTSEPDISQMNLLDIIEMFCDWKAATMRHANGDLVKSIEINKDRFKISPQLIEIFKNSLKELNW